MAHTNASTTTPETAVADAVTPLLAARGLALYDVELSGSGRARVLRVLVTAADPKRGVDLDAIAGAAEVLSPVLDAPEMSRLLPGPYALEVSSPGLERPLRRPEHYRGAIGEEVSVKRHGTPRARGTVVAADDVSFELAYADGTTEHVAYDDVEKARTVFMWGAGEEKKR